MKKLSDFLNEKYIKLELNATNKKEVLNELSSIIKDEITDNEKFLFDLFERENSGSTGLENGLAIPHVRSSAIKNFVVAVGTKSEGIDFDSIDDKKSTLFFLIATNNKYNDYHIETLKNITKLVNSLEIVDILSNTKSKEGFIDIIRQLEKIEY